MNEDGKKGNLDSDKISSISDIIDFDLDDESLDDELISKDSITKPLTSTDDTFNKEKLGSTLKREESANPKSVSKSHSPIDQSSSVKNTSKSSTQGSILDAVKEEQKKNQSPDENTHKEPTYSNKKSLIRAHISFGTRLFFMMLGIIIFIVVAGLSIYEAFRYDHSETVIYNESANINYQVCLGKNDFYDVSCLEEGMEYISMITNRIPIEFQYTSSYSKEMEYNYEYYVSGKLKIYDRDDPSKILYKRTDVLVDNKPLKGKGSAIDLSTKVDLDYKKYNDYVNTYKSKYLLSSDGVIEVSLYLKGENETKSVATISIPLSQQTYGITKDTVNSDDQMMLVRVGKWNETNYVCMGIGILSLLICILIFVQMFGLINKGSGRKSKYLQTLNKILREYDRVIVVAKTPVEADDSKTVIRVDSFEELLDARDSLEKPIIYSKINDVKSEFTVEDNDRIFKYVMKEADYIN